MATDTGTMKIIAIEPFILHVPVTGGGIADSTHRISHWGLVGARIQAEGGLTGYGFTGTHAHLPSDRLIARWIGDCIAPLLVGEDAHDVLRLGQKVARNPALQWVGRAGVDGNYKWDLATCQRFCVAAEDLDLFWFEEPLWHDDVKGHARLARSTRIPLALGEQPYTTDAYSEFFAQQAVHWVQPDVTRMAGLTEVLRICETALAWHLPVAPHAGDMSQVHLHLAYAHPACAVLEYLPWIAHCFTDPATVLDGFFRLPALPGAGTTPTTQACSECRQSLG